MNIYQFKVLIGAVINGQHLVRTSVNAPFGQSFFHILSKQNITEEFCNIDNGHSLRVEFTELSKISDVLIQEIALGEDLSKYTRIIEISSKSVVTHVFIWNQSR